MNTDIRLSVGFWQHPKTKKTVKRLGLEGIRSLQVLWLWAAQNKPDGNLAGMDWEDIELAADWQGEERAFFDHCLGVWIDEAEGGYVLHDWAEHNPWQAEAEARKEQARKNATAGWEKRRAKRPHDSGNADSMPPQCDGNAPAKQPHDFGNAPSPYPSPNQEENTSPPVESLVNQDRARSPERGSEGVGADLSGPGLEFVELREFYNREMRAEGPLAGFAEYKQLKAARDMTGASLWPGNARLFDDLAARKDAGVWSRGFEIGLGRYLREKTWLAPVTGRAQAATSAPTEHQRRQQESRAMARARLAMREDERAAANAVHEGMGAKHEPRSIAS
ncbi:hypothetical protein [Desulfovibrio sp. ZJ200]|uniref:hypothetical protein n=1 Tax=Desulfovibrio sp. ZJ200 TaxID=2709792 RepID=UPI0013E9C117|nr:hypothetical protein [Desulfovibrio sp. ZJ200]